MSFLARCLAAERPAHPERDGIGHCSFEASPENGSWHFGALTFFGAAIIGVASR
jgi:hypothetical protein